MKTNSLTIGRRPEYEVVVPGSVLAGTGHSYRTTSLTKAKQFAEKHGARVHKWDMGRGTSEVIYEGRVPSRRNEAPGLWHGSL